MVDLEDGGDTFLRNIGLRTDCKALHPRGYKAKMEILSLNFFYGFVSLNNAHTDDPYTVGK
jgi:hypothetical protein